MSTIEAVEDRVDKLEEQISTGFREVKDLIRSEIKDLKEEQISDLREGYKRVADDQRRLWDEVHVLLQRDAQRLGGERKLGALVAIFTGALGGVISALATYLSIGKH